ncbi:hypothetical protein DFH09DRAFT_1180557 [Mycena vulgaris]|nr:hypothetical protein DFH09DRAFT_1180557 [Mycena vulgaris]
MADFAAPVVPTVDDKGRLISKFIKDKIYPIFKERQDAPATHGMETTKDYVGSTLFPMVKKEFQIDGTYAVGPFKETMYGMLNNKKNYTNKKRPAELAIAPASRKRGKNVLGIFKEAERTAIKEEVRRRLVGVVRTSKDDLALNLTHKVAQEMFDGSTPTVKKAMTDEAEAYNLQLEAGPSAEEIAEEITRNQISITTLVALKLQELVGHGPGQVGAAVFTVAVLYKDAEGRICKSSVSMGKKGLSDLRKFKYSAEEQTRLMKWGKQLLVRVLQDEDGTLILLNDDLITLSRHELLAILSEYFEAGGATVRVPITRESERVLVDLEKAAVEEIREYHGEHQQQGSRRRGSQ